MDTWYNEGLSEPGLVDLCLRDSAGDSEVRSENIYSSVTDTVMTAVFTYVTVPALL